VVRAKPEGEELDRIGDLGEGEFRMLCRRAGLHCSKVEPDRTGKDFIVEFKLAEPNGITSIDRRPPPAQIVVQVKTILAKNDTVRLSLSVAERLAKDTRPTVVAILRIDEQDQFVDLHLVHLIDGRLGRVLQALRKASKIKNARLHERTISFKISHGSQVERNAPAVYAAFAGFAAGNMLEYGVEKRRQIEELGFEAYRYNMKFSLPHAPDDIVDGLLGLKRLDIENVVITERRFKIDLPWDTIAKATIGALACPVNILGNWIGLFVPIKVSTASDEDGVVWTGKQMVKAVVEVLDADDLEASFDAFRRKYCELRGATLVFVQKAGDFLVGETTLMDLRSAPSV
jgi:hypothetical protein